MRTARCSRKWRAVSKKSASANVRKRKVWQPKRQSRDLLAGHRSRYHLTARRRRIGYFLRALGVDDYGTSIVSYEERCRGWTDYIHRATTPETRVEGYARLRANLRFYSSLAVWDYDAAADAIFVALTGAMVRVGTKDLRIASIALANNATLLTRNTSDFARVSNLRVEDWTI